MGFDISNHPVDVRFIRHRLIPAVRRQAEVGGFLDRAAQMAAVAHRANHWGLRVTSLNSEIVTRQIDASPPRAAPTVAQSSKSGWISRLFKARPAAAPRVRDVTGLPNFDSDLSVWGRPFFISARGTDDALEVLGRYMNCAAGDLDAIDTIARSQLELIEAGRGERPANVLPQAWDIVLQFIPLLAHLPPREEEQPEPAAIREHLASRLDLMQAVWTQRLSDEPLEHPCLMEPERAAMLARTLPHEIIGLAAQGLPGWMGRGYAWPTELFRKIGVKVSHVFETPAALFAELLEDMPALEEGFHRTITSNFTLGGYVPPERIPELKALLLRHRRELILAWNKAKDVSDTEVEAMSADFQKILEPVVLAERNGYGFIEAAEVYSGFMGAMN